jgi:hypothetical protein
LGYLIELFEGEFTSRADANPLKPKESGEFENPIPCHFQQFVAGKPAADAASHLRPRLGELAALTVG